jgi:hypothetical protein
MALDRTWYNTLVDDDGSGLTGSVWDKADVDALMDAVDAELAKTTAIQSAICKVVAPAVPCTSGAWLTVPFAGAAIDPINMHTDGDIYIRFPAVGIYGVSIVTTWAAGAGGRRLWAFVDSVEVPPGQVLQKCDATYGAAVQLTTLAYVNIATAKLSVQVFQDSGGSQNVAVQMNVWRIS